MAGDDRLVVTIGRHQAERTLTQAHDRIERRSEARLVDEPTSVARLGSCFIRANPAAKLRHLRSNAPDFRNVTACCATSGEKSMEVCEVFRTM